MIGKIFKWLLIFIVMAVIGLAIWGYAPDHDPEELRAEYGQAPSQFIKLPSGQNIHLRDEGPRDAPVILLLHGSNASLHTWDGWTQELTKKYRVIRYDQPGHGLTGSHITRDYTAKGFSDTAADVMKYLNIDRYIIGGNSMGGWASWNHALDYPDQVRGLILIDASGVPDSNPTELPLGFRLANTGIGQSIVKIFTPRSIIRSSIESTYGDPSRVTDKQVDLYWAMQRYPGNREAMVDRMRLDRSPASTEQMERITVPTLIMWGAKDTLTPVSGTDWFAAHIPATQKVIYDDLGHIPMEEAPGRTVKDVETWLEIPELRAVALPSQGVPDKG